MGDEGNGDVKRRDDDNHYIDTNANRGGLGGGGDNRQVKNAWPETGRYDKG